MKYTKNDLPVQIKKDNLIPFWKAYEKYGCFSNWHQSTVGEFKTSEHAMMYKKAELFGDKEVGEMIKNVKTCKEAKDLGREVKNFKQNIWDQNKERIMIDVLTQKFTEHEDLKKILLSTGDKVLVEASPLDKIWGIKMAADNPDIYYPARWQGENLLGFYLMEVRDIIRNN